MSLCASCGTENAPDAGTCAKCGATLGAEAMQLGMVCPGCDTYNSPGVSVCSACGHALAPAGFTGLFKVADIVPGAPAEPAPAPAGDAPVPAAQTAGPAPRVCSLCKTPNGEEARFCSNCGAPLGGSGGTMVLRRADLLAGAGAGAAKDALPPGRGKLILIRGEGFEGAEYRLGADKVPAGRNKGLVLFPSDAFLGDLHATFYYEGGRLHLRDEGTPSGTWIRLRDPAPIAAGDELAVGHHRLRFTGSVGSGEAGPEGRVLGAPVAEGALRVEDVLTGGRPGQAWVSHGPALTVGRESCDVALSTDGYVSAQHCRITADAAGARVEDLGSVNGTFVRLPAGEGRALAHGDYLMMGQQVLRVEIGR